MGSSKGNELILLLSILTTFWDFVYLKLCQFPKATLKKHSCYLNISNIIILEQNFQNVDGKSENYSKWRIENG